MNFMFWGDVLNDVRKWNDQYKYANYAPCITVKYYDFFYTWENSPTTCVIERSKLNLVNLKASFKS